MPRKGNKPRTRPLEEILRRQRVDWEELFNDILGNNSTSKSKWTLELVDKPPPKTFACKHYAMIRADSVFQCEPCANKQWGSAWGWVSIWYLFERSSRSGVVYLRIFGQQCKQCASATEERGRVYAGAIWDQNEIEDTWKVFRQEVDLLINEPRPPRREPPPTFSPMAGNWNNLFEEMFADFRQQVPYHKWILFHVDKDLPTKPMKGPSRMCTDSGDFFIWIGMGNKDRDRNLGKVCIRLLKPKKNTVRDLALWDIETTEMVLFAVYQKVGSTFYDRIEDKKLPQLEDVTPFWLLPQNLARHKSEFCEACHENLCKNGNRDGLRTIIRNPLSKGPRIEPSTS